MEKANVSLTVQSNLENLSRIRGFIEEAAGRAGLSGQGISEIRLAVDEVCANVMTHGYKNTSGVLDICVDQTDNKMIVTVSDDAPPYNPLQETPIPDLEAPLDQRPLGGMGVLLVKQNTDWVEYKTTESGGNALIMTKICPGQ